MDGARGDGRDTVTGRSCDGPAFSRFQAYEGWVHLPARPHPREPNRRRWSRGSRGGVTGVARCRREASIVVQTVEAASIAPDVAPCLGKRGAPDDVVRAARTAGEAARALIARDPLAARRALGPVGPEAPADRRSLAGRALLTEGGSIPASQAAREARVQAAKALIAVAPESPLHRSAWYVGGVCLAAASPTARLEARHAFRALLDDVASQAGRRVTRREAATLDADHELALIAVAQAAYTLGLLDPAVGQAKQRGAPGTRPTPHA